MWPSSFAYSADLEQCSSVQGDHSVDQAPICRLCISPRLFCHQGSTSKAPGPDEMTTGLLKVLRQACGAGIVCSSKLGFREGDTVMKETYAAISKPFHFMLRLHAAVKLKPRLGCSSPNGAAFVEKVLGRLAETYCTILGLQSPQIIKHMADSMHHTAMTAFNKVHSAGNSVYLRRSNALACCRRTLACHCTNDS